MDKRSVVAYKDGKYQYFNSISDCSNKLGLDVHTVANLVNHKATSEGIVRKSLGGYQIVAEDEVDDIDKSYKPSTHGKRVQRKVRATKDKESYVFDSLRQAQGKLDISRQSIKKALDNDKSSKGWTFEYLD